MSKILVVDDNPEIVDTLKVFLESNGFSVVSACNGEEGLSKAKQENPNLIILDAMMETVDKGFVVARQLKKDESYKHIPIIMLTAMKKETGFDFKKDAGDETWVPVDDYCDKPVKLDELHSKIETLLQKNNT